MSDEQRLLLCGDLSESQCFGESMMIVFGDMREGTGRGNAQWEDDNQTEVL